MFQRSVVSSIAGCNPAGCSHEERGHFIRWYLTLIGTGFVGPLVGHSHRERHEIFVRHYDRVGPTDVTMNLVYEGLSAVGSAGSSVILLSGV